RAIFAMHFQNQIAQSFIQIRFALPNAAPPNAVQVRLVDNAAKRAPALRFVLVNVIERKTGIETKTPADVDAPTQSTGDFQSSARECEPCGPVVLQALVFVRRVAALIGVYQ